MEQTGYYLPYILLQLPTILILLAGIAMAAMRWKKHSRISLLALIGFVLLLLAMLLGLSSSLSATFMMQMGMSMSGYATFVAVISVARSVFEIIGFGLLVAAIFNGRSQ
jgi:hypothetical protein